MQPLSSPQPSALKFKNILMIVLGACVLSSTFFFVSICAKSYTKTALKPNIQYIDPKNAPSDTIAEIGDIKFTNDNFFKEMATEYHKLKQHEFKVKNEQLFQHLVDTIIGKEALAAGIPLNDYIQKHITHDIQEPSDAKYQDFIKTHGITQTISPEDKKRILAYMQNEKRMETVQAYIAKKTENTPIKAYFTEPRMNLQVETGDAAVWGPNDAPVKIIVFSDFQCPFCSNGATILNKIKKNYGNKVQAFFKHYPLPSHPQAKTASQCALCVKEQDTLTKAENKNERFWAYHDVLFQNKGASFSDENLIEYAKKVGINEDTFKECVEQKRYVQAVEKDIQQGQALGINGTPAFIINGELVSGANEPEIMRFIEIGLKNH